MATYRSWRVRIRLYGQWHDQFENAGQECLRLGHHVGGCAIGNGAASGVAMVTDSSTGSNDALFMVGQVGNFPWVMFSYQVDGSVTSTSRRARVLA